MKDCSTATLQALYAVARMIEAGQVYPHDNCACVEPTFNICPPCKKYAYCVAKQDLKKNIEVLRKLDGG